MSATWGLAMAIRLSTRRVWMIRDWPSTRLISASGSLNDLDQVSHVLDDLLIRPSRRGPGGRSGASAGRVAGKLDDPGTRRLRRTARPSGTGSSGMTLGIDTPRAVAPGRAAGACRAARCRSEPGASNAAEGPVSAIGTIAVLLRRGPRIAPSETSRVRGDRLGPDRAAGQHRHQQQSRTPAPAGSRPALAVPVPATRNCSSYLDSRTDGLPRHRRAGPAGLALPRPCDPRHAWPVLRPLLQTNYLI